MMKTDIVLRTTIKHCQTHKKRMLYAANKMSKYLPLNEDSYNKLTEDQIQTIDQFIYRFTKLQDTIGKTLFKATLVI